MGGLIYFWCYRACSHYSGATSLELTVSWMKTTHSADVQGKYLSLPSAFHSLRCYDNKLHHPLIIGGKFWDDVATPSHWSEKYTHNLKSVCIFIWPNNKRASGVPYIILSTRPTVMPWLENSNFLCTQPDIFKDDHHLLEIYLSELCIWRHSFAIQL